MPKPPPVRTSRSTVIAVLNGRWRVVDNGTNWTLEYREAGKSTRSSGWKPRGGHHRKRELLLSKINSRCGEVSEEALALLRALPERHQ